MPNLGLDTLPSQRVPQKILKKISPYTIPSLYAYDMFAINKMARLCPAVIAIDTIIASNNHPIIALK